MGGLISEGRRRKGVWSLYSAASLANSLQRGRPCAACGVLGLPGRGGWGDPQLDAAPQRLGISASGCCPPAYGPHTRLGSSTLPKPRLFATTGARLQWDWERAGTAQHPQPKELQHQLPAPPPFSFCTAVGSPLGTPSCTASP